MTRIALGLCLVLLAACGRPEQRFPPQTEITFKSNCTAHDRSPEQQAYCACTWDKIEAAIDPNSFAALEQLPTSQREAHPLMRQIRGYMQVCRGTAPVEQAPQP